MTDSTVACEFCNASLCSKYVLKKHLLTNKSCLEIRNITLTPTFICKECNTGFLDKQKLSVHYESCKEHIKYTLRTTLQSEFEIQINELKKTHEQQLINKENEWRKLHETNIKVLSEEVVKLTIQLEERQKYTDKLEEKITKNETMIESLLKDSVNKTTTHTTIENQYNTVLSNKHTIDSFQQKDIEHIIRTNYNEEVFVEGQQGIARMCVNYIIKAPDGKLALCCTDASRKKFKMYEIDGNLHTDFNAIKFCKIIKTPFSTVNKEIYEKKIDSIEKRIKTLKPDQYSTHITLIKDKEKIEKLYIANCWFDDTKYNTDFVTEMCKLLYIK